MQASALTLPLPFTARREREAPAARCGLAFDSPGGPVVAVCGLVGGSGASTLAYALARQAACESRAPVLLSECAVARGDLAALAGAASDLSLPELAQRVRDERAPARSVVEIEPRLRLIASPPRPVTHFDGEAVEELLGQAREAHGLVVVDCATAWASPGPVFARATDVLWTLPARADALARAEALWNAGIAPKPGRWREALVASVTERRARVSVRGLRRLAATRCDRLILTPYIEGCSRDSPSGDSLARTLGAIGALLSGRAT